MSHSLEKKLSSWVPRRPSAKIHRALFHERGNFDLMASTLPRWPWIAPAAAALLAGFVLLSAAHLLPRSRPDDRPPMAILMSSTLGSSNVEGSSWLGGAGALTKIDVNLEWNIWREAIFDWTNGSQSTSSMGFSPRSRTRRHGL